MPTKIAREGIFSYQDEATGGAVASQGQYLNNLAVWLVQTISIIYHKPNKVNRKYT